MNAGFFVSAMLLAVGQAESPEARWKELHQEMVKQIRDGNYDGAESAGRRAFQVAARMGSPDAPTAETLIEMARLESKQGSFVDALDHIQQARQRLEKLAGKHPELEARACNVQAHVLDALGQSEQAAQLAVKAHKLRLKKFGAEHLETVESVDTLAALGHAYDEIRGEGLYGVAHWDIEERSLKVREKLLGKLHPETAPSHVAVARAHWRDADGEKHLRQALKLWAKLNPKHPELAETWCLLGRHLRLRNQLDEAEHAVKQALKLWRYHDDSGWPPPAARGLLELALVRGQQRKIGDADKMYREALEQYFTWVRDDDLCSFFVDIALDHRSFGTDGTSLTSAEAFLMEMTRRGGPVIEKALAKRAQEQLKKRLAKKQEDFQPARNLEMLTALRRLQKLRDPVGIEIKGPATREVIFPNLPELEVALVNQDEKKTSVGYQRGGDNRTGRLERWRIEARDAKGNVLPVIDYLSEFGGGLFGYGVLKPGQKWETSLNLHGYVRLPPGDYTLRVQYHDIDCIAGMDWVGGRIVCQSEEIRLHIQPRVIDVSAEERKAIQELIEKLNGKEPLRVLSSYTKDAHRIIAPDSPQGRLLSLGWKAVPQMIDEAVDEATALRQRMWLLSLLYTATGYHDPRGEDGVLSDWSGQGRSVSNAKVDADRQLAFARRWEEFRKHIVVRGDKRCARFGHKASVEA